MSIDETSSKSGPFSATAPTGLSRRFGRTPFYLQLSQEQYAATGSGSWRATITYRPPGTRKAEAELPLFDVSPRHPLFTVTIGGESFPLLIGHCEDIPRSGIIVGGSRKMMLKSVHTVEWTAKLRPTVTRAGAQIKVEFGCRIDPPLPARTTGSLRIELFTPMLQPEPWWFPYAPASHRGATLLRGAQCGVALSVILPEVDDAPIRLIQESNCSTSLLQSVPNILRRGKGAYAFRIAFDVARTRAHAQFMHMRHTVRMLAPEFPAPDKTAPATGLRQRALAALQRMTDKGAYDVVGVERVYVKAQTDDPDSGHEFCAGFPHFPLDGARAMLDWDRLIGDETAARLALLISRGIATDFAVTQLGENGLGINKGAFWDRRSGLPGASDAQFTDFMGDDFHSVASTARIASGLLSVHQRTGDTTSLNAAITACQWLILKQNAAGYYDGDRVCPTTGAVVGNGESLTGVEVVSPLVQAYRATSNEIFVKTGMRVARHLTDVLMPSLIAGPIYGANFTADNDTPVTVASIIRAMAVAYSEAATRRTREELELAGIWLRSWDLTQIHRDHSANRDGHHDGVNEIARAALQMFAIFREPLWLNMALDLSRVLPNEEEEAGWQALPLFVETLLGLISLVPNAQPDLQDYKARVGWTTFLPDSSTRQYIRVHLPDQSGDDDPAIDYLPLVARVEGRVLIPVLAHNAPDRICIANNGRFPNLRDLVTGEIVCQPAPLHKLPFASSAKWGCFTIDP